MGVKAGDKKKRAKRSTWKTTAGPRSVCNGGKKAPPGTGSRTMGRQVEKRQDPQLDLIKGKTLCEKGTGKQIRPLWNVGGKGSKK